MMLSRRNMLGCAACAALLSAIPAAALAASAQDADPTAWLVEMMNATLSDIRKDPALAKADAGHVRRFVSDRILPVVDFPRMTRTAVGPRWRQATADQRDALQAGFRNLLIRVYSGAFNNVKDYKAEALKGKPVSGSTPIIRTRLISKSAQPVQVDYRLAREDGGWKIIDVNVAGIWLVQNYHSQFGSILANGGIPALIASMNDKNSALNQKK